MQSIRYLLRTTERGLRVLSLCLAGVGSLMLVIMLVVVCANIIMRPFGASLRGTVEISGYLCVLAVGLCMPAAQLAGSHITAGLWATSLPRPLRRLQAPLVSLLCAGLLAVVTQDLIIRAIDMRQWGEIIDGVGLPIYPIAFGFAVGIGLHCLIFIHGLLTTMFIPESRRMRHDRGATQSAQGERI